MEKIKIAFSGFGGKFNDEDNFIINLLRERYHVVLSKNPDYLFFSQNSKDYLNYKCPRIFYTPENLVPDFNICDYGIGFHYLNFEDRYLRFPLYLVDNFVAYNGDDYASDLELAQQKHVNVEGKLKGKSDFCSFVYSNAEAAKCREKMFESLSEYKQVSSGGRYRNNVGGAIESKLDFQKKHKFVIAFENTSTSGYTTEKIVHAFAAGAIPIYWGNHEIGKEFNSKSFINCHDFGLTEKGEPEVIKKIIEEIQRIDQNNEVYLEMLKTPAFTKENNVSEQKRAFENFLFDIVDQSLESAYRRNRFYWGERYERKQIIGNKFYWQCRKIIPLRDFVKKFKWG